MDREIQNESNARLGVIDDGLQHLKTVLFQLERPLTHMTTAMEQLQDGLRSKFPKKPSNFLESTMPYD